MTSKGSAGDDRFASGSEDDAGIRIDAEYDQEIVGVDSWNRLLEFMLFRGPRSQERDPIQVEIAAEDGQLCVWNAEPGAGADAGILTRFPRSAPRVAREYLLDHPEWSDCRLQLRSRDEGGAVIWTSELRVSRRRSVERDPCPAREAMLDTIMTALRRCVPIHQEDVERVAETIEEEISRRIASRETPRFSGDPVTQTPTVKAWNLLEEVARRSRERPGIVARAVKDEWSALLIDAIMTALRRCVPIPQEDVERVAEAIEDEISRRVASMPAETKSKSSQADNSPPDARLISRRASRFPSDPVTYELTAKAWNLLEEVVRHSRERTGMVARAVESGLSALSENAVLPLDRRRDLEMFALMISECGEVGNRWRSWRDAVHALLGLLRPDPLTEAVRCLTRSITREQARDASLGSIDPPLASPDQFDPPLTAQQRGLLLQAIALADRQRFTAKLRADIDSLGVFHASAAHVRDDGDRGSSAIPYSRVVGAIAALTRLAGRPRLLEVSLGILREMSDPIVSVEMSEQAISIRYWEAALFWSAARALVGATPPPELGDKLLVLETIRSLCDGWTGPGDAEVELARELGVSLPEPRVESAEKGRKPQWWEGTSCSARESGDPRCHAGDRCDNFPRCESCGPPRM